VVNTNTVVELKEKLNRENIINRETKGSKTMSNGQGGRKTSKVIDAYTIAKSLKGGTGGRRISNEDLSAVLDKWGSQFTSETEMKKRYEILKQMTKRGKEAISSKKKKRTKKLKTQQIGSSMKHGGTVKKNRSYNFIN